MQHGSTGESAVLVLPSLTNLTLGLFPPREWVVWHQLPLILRAAAHVFRNASAPDSLLGRAPGLKVLSFERVDFLEYDPPDSAPCAPRKDEHGVVRLDSLTLRSLKPCDARAILSAFLRADLTPTGQTLEHLRCHSIGASTSHPLLLPPTAKLHALLTLNIGKILMFNFRSPDSGTPFRHPRRHPPSAAYTAHRERCHDVRPAPVYASLPALKMLALHFIDTLLYSRDNTSLDNEAGARDEASWSKLDALFAQAPDTLAEVRIHTNVDPDTGRLPDVEFFAQRLPAVAGKLSVHLEPGRV
ncbi:hypothetical protein C8J57DRAFT_1733373 [Mycena rebaudengoi]|nr:hypothetical protein C8J57DRAFT_1733373 [Mycena rebaudengoi]